MVATMAAYLEVSLPTHHGVYRTVSVSEVVRLRHRGTSVATAPVHRQLAYIDQGPLGPVVSWQASTHEAVSLKRPVFTSTFKCLSMSLAMAMARGDSIEAACGTNAEADLRANHRNGRC